MLLFSRRKRRRVNGLAIAGFDLESVSDTSISVRRSHISFDLHLWIMPMVDIRVDSTTFS